MSTSGVQSLPKEWALFPVRKIAELTYGKALRAKDRVGLGEVPVFGSGGLVGRHDQALHDGPSIVIGRKGTVGTIYYTPGPFWCIDTAFYLDQINPALDVEFLAAVLEYIDLSRLSIVVGVPGINRKDIESQQVIVPPLPEQRYIAAILRDAEMLRGVRQESDGKTKELLPALFHEKFGDPSANPNGWDVVPLSKMGQLDRGRSRHRPRDAAHLYGGEYPFIQTGDVANADGWITRYTQTYSEAGLAQSKLWPKGTLCITIAANIAKTAILTFDACFPDSVVGFIAGPGIHTEYVRQWLVTAQGHLEALAPQGAQKNINLEILKSLRIPNPPETLQARFAENARELREVITDQKDSGAQFDALFESLVSDAMSGRLSAAWREQRKDELALAAAERDQLLGVARPVELPRPLALGEPRQVEAAVVTVPRREQIIAALSEDQRKVLALALAAEGHFTADTLDQTNAINPLAVELALRVLAAAGLVMPLSLQATSSDNTPFFFCAYRALEPNDDALIEDATA